MTAVALTTSNADEVCEAVLADKNNSSGVEKSSKNTFTFSYANQKPSLLVPSRSDHQKQKLMVAEHRQKLHEAFIARNEALLQLSEHDSVVAVKLLLSVAANEDIRYARKSCYENSVIEFCVQMWSAFIKEADNLLFSDGSSHVKEAIENISSLGIWYNGPDISLPLRRYTVRVPNAAGEEENVVLLGLISFTYSSYIMQLRSMAQQTTLATLAYLREQLRTNCLFVPPLLVASRQQ